MRVPPRAAGQRPQGVRPQLGTAVPKKPRLLAVQVAGHGDHRAADGEIQRQIVEVRAVDAHQGGELLLQAVALEGQRVVRDAGGKRGELGHLRVGTQNGTQAAVIFKQALRLLQGAGELGVHQLAGVADHRPHVAEQDGEGEDQHGQNDAAARQHPPMFPQKMRSRPLALHRKNASPFRWRAPKARPLLPIYHSIPQGKGKTIIFCLARLFFVLRGVAGPGERRHFWRKASIFAKDKKRWRRAKSESCGGAGRRLY